MPSVSNTVRVGCAAAALVGAALGLMACSRTDASADNAINSARADAAAEHRTLENAQAQAGNMALAPLSNSAPANAAP